MKQEAGREEGKERPIVVAGVLLLRIRVSWIDLWAKHLDKVVLEGKVEPVEPRCDINNL